MFSHPPAVRLDGWLVDFPSTMHTLSTSCAKKNPHDLPNLIPTMILYPSHLPSSPLISPHLPSPPFPFHFPFPTFAPPLFLPFLSLQSSDPIIPNRFLEPLPGSLIGRGVRGVNRSTRPLNAFLSSCARILPVDYPPPGLSPPEGPLRSFFSPYFGSCLGMVLGLI